MIGATVDLGCLLSDGRPRHEPQTRETLQSNCMVPPRNLLTLVRDISARPISASLTLARVVGGQTWPWSRTRWRNTYCGPH